MNKKIKRLLITSSILTGAAAVSGTVVYEMYKFSSEQGEKRFVAPEHTTIKQFFGDQSDDAVSKPLVREKYIAGEKGYIVNNGPVRITTAYKSLFPKDSLIELSNWVHDNVTWGANALSLKDITFTTGVDKTEQGTTKGFHTAGRTGSAIFISPDAFEDLGSLGDDVFKKVTSTLVSGYRTDLQKQVEATNTKNELSPNIDSGLNDFLAAQFNGVSSGVSNAGTYKTLDSKSVEDTYGEIVDDAWSDDYISKIKGSQLSTAATSTLLGNLNFTNPERLAYMKSHSKLDEGLDRYKTKIAFNAAYKLILKATGGANGLGNTYLSLALKNILFEDGAAKDEAGNTIMYKLRDRKDWDTVSGISANNKIFKSDTDSILASGIGSGYFKNLNDNLGIPAKTVNLRAGIYQLFVKYFDNAMTYLGKKDSPYNVVKKLWNDPKAIAANTWINEARTFGPSDRVRWILTGKFPQEVKLNVLYGDEWMLTEGDKAYINGLDRDNVMGRMVSVDVEGVYSDAITKQYDVLGKISIADYYRKLMLSSIKYTLSHEYGHHETMWSTYGVYGKKEDGQIGNFQDTVNLYSDQTAAKGEDFIWRNAFDELRKIAGGGNSGTSVEEQGIRNALDIMMKSGDKYSNTWTPSYFVHQYSGFTPSAGWTHASETLTQPKLEFKTDENGNPQIQLGDTETIGQTPIEFDTNGVDSNGQQNQSNYIFSINKDALSDDNPAKSDPTRIGDFLRLMVTPSQLLYGYQTSKWLLEGHKNGDAWANAQGIALPDIDTSGLKEPTTQFSSLLAQDPSDKKSKIMSLIGILRLQYGLQDQYALEIIKQLDVQVKALYDKIIASTPNMYETTSAGGKRLNGYDRSKVVFNQIMSDTTSLLKDKTDDEEYDVIKTTKGIYYDPKTVSYIALKGSKNFDEHGIWRELDSKLIDDLFDDNKKSFLVKSGTVVLGSPQTAFADYTGNFAEFMTRIVQQLTFRPNYDDYRDASGQIDKSQLVKANEGWYDDMNRFNAQGMNMYGMKGHDSSLKVTGAKLMNWYRSMLGLHVDDLNYIKTDTAGNVDIDALDKQIAYADPLTRIYRNSKTNLTSMWGWIPESMKDIYKYVILKDKVTGAEIKVHISTKNISNYFYRSDMTNDPKNSNKHSMTMGYREWVADWQVMGDYVNADVKNGKYTMLFADETGKTYPPDTDNKVPVSHKSKEDRTNNDYNNTLAEISYTIDTTKDETEIEIEIN